MWSGFQAEKLNTRGELVVAANQAEPVPGPDHHDKKNSTFFQKITYPIACSAHKGAAWIIKICLRKGVFHFSH